MGVRFLIWAKLVGSLAKRVNDGCERNSPYAVLSNSCRCGGRNQAELAHHSDVVSAGEVLRNLAIKDAIHMDVLNLERPTGGSDADQHPAIDWKLRRSPVRAAIGAADNNPFSLRDRVQNRKLRIREVDLDLLEHVVNSGASHLPAMVSAVFGEAGCGRAEVAPIKSIVKFSG